MLFFSAFPANGRTILLPSVYCNLFYLFIRLYVEWDPIKAQRHVKETKLAVKGAAKDDIDFAPNN